MKVGKYGSIPKKTAVFAAIFDWSFHTLYIPSLVNL